MIMQAFSRPNSALISTGFMGQMPCLSVTQPTAFVGTATCIVSRGMSTCAGSEGEHQAHVPADPRCAVHPLPQAGQVQEAAVLPLLFPLGVD